MVETLERRDRLHRLLDLARVSKKWSRAELGRALRRDATKLYTDSGNPKLDFLVSLANVLEWPVGEVVDAVWGSRNPDDAGLDEAQESFDALDKLALEAHRNGRYAEMVQIARRQFEVAESAADRALACNREYGGWDGLGRHQNALDAARRGLQEGPIPATRRVQLQGNLANAYYALWDLVPALGIANMLIEWHEENPPTELATGKRKAFAHYVRGQTHRRMMETEPESLEMHARKAEADLRYSRDLYLELARELDDDSLAGIANTCSCGLLEVEVALGQRSANDAIDELMENLAAVIDTDSSPVGDWLESYGWCCIFGSNIALRDLGGRDLQRVLAVFTNKALEIAEKLDNWAMRERVFTMQYSLHRAISDATGFDIDFTVDDEDRRLIVGTMGRFPTFRATGWRILETAKVVAN